MNTPLMTNIGTSRSQSWIREDRVFLISCSISENLIPWATILVKTYRWHSPSPLSDLPSVHSLGHSILLGDQQHFSAIAIQGFLSCRSSIPSPAWWSTYIEAMPLTSHFLNLTLSTGFSLCTSSLSWSPSSILKSAALTCVVDGVAGCVPPNWFTPRLVSCLSSPQSPSLLLRTCAHMGIEFWPLSTDHLFQVPYHHSSFPSFFLDITLSFNYLVVIMSPRKLSSEFLGSVQGLACLLSGSKHNCGSGSPTVY